ncbi:MAG: glycosyltransferase family 39 protein [Anaerolineae bacterium]
MNALAASRRSGLALVVALTSLGNVVALSAAGDWPLVAWAGGLLVMCAVPGYLLAVVLLPRRDSVDPLERSVIAVGLGYGALILGAMGVHYVPGPITPSLTLALFDVLIGALVIVTALIERDGEPIALPRDALWHVALVLAVAALFRLPNIGYAEFQGDEATIMAKAAAAVEGRGDALFVHKKGPAEILVPTAFYGLVGRTSETMARLPFALATMVGILGLYQLGRSMFNPFVGLVAALLLSLNGFFVGFGRVLQYQGIVFLFSTLALLCVCLYYSDRDPARRFLGLSVVFVGLGMLAQYDTVFVVPAAAYLVLLRWWRDRQALGRDLVAIFGAAAIVLVVLLAFFVPWSQHPYFRESTLPYLFDVRVGGDDGPLHNTLGNSLLLSTFYNSTYYMAFLAATLAAAIAHHLWRTGRQWVGAVLTGVFLIGAVLLVAAPDAWEVGGVNASLAFMLGFVLVLLASRSPAPEWKAQLLWFSAGFVFYATLVKSPRTHFHVAFPAWSVLSATALDELRVRLPSLRARRVAGLGFAALFAGFAFYPYLVFVQHDVEYRRAFPAVKPPGYWTLTDELPTNGWFGFPYRAGWKAVGAMFADGALRGSYFSNEEEKITNWYTRGAIRCDQEPRYYVIAEGVQDDRPVPLDMAAAGYGEIARVTSGGRTRITIYERGQPSSQATESAAAADSGASGASPGAEEPDAGVTVYAVEDVVARYDSELSAPDFEPLLPYGYETGYVAVPFVTDDNPDGVVFDGKARLVGVDYDTEPLAPGDEAALTLYWQGLQPMQKDYSVFVHLTDPDDATAVRAQSDGAPGICGKPQPATTWEPGRIVLDRRVLRLPDDLPDGDYVLRGGLYDYETLERLPVSSSPDVEPGRPGSGAPGDQAGVIGVITVRRSS